MNKLFILAALFVGVAQAQNMTVTYVAPATYSDGSTAQPAGDISGYQITCRFLPKGGGSDLPCTLSKNTLAGGTATTDTLTATVPATGGNVCIKLSTVSKIVATGNASAETCKTFAPLTTIPPTGVIVVQVTISSNMAPVFRIVSSNGSPARGELYGLIPIGRACEGPVLYRWRGKSYRKVTVNPDEVFGTSDLGRLSAPCS